MILQDVAQPPHCVSEAEEDDVHAKTNLGGLKKANDTVIFEPHAQDVLMGRGKKFYGHPGNIVYTDLIGSNRDAYFSTMAPVDKKSIIEGIVDQILEEGRFLKRDTKGECWIPISRERALTKTAHAIQYRQRKSLKEGNTTPPSVSAYLEAINPASVDEVAAAPPAVVSFSKMDLGSLPSVGSLAPVSGADSLYSYQLELYGRMSRLQALLGGAGGGSGLWLPCLQDAHPERRRVSMAMDELQNCGNGGIHGATPCPSLSSLLQEVSSTSSCMPPAAISPLSSVFRAKPGFLVADAFTDNNTETDFGMSPELLRTTSIGSFVTVHDEADVSLADINW